jgi:beta-N-acetylhexosaminidase
MLPALPLTLLASLASCADPVAPPRVRLGIEVLLDERIELVEGKRVGLITHPAGVDGALVATADRLAGDERFELVALFGPEHGIRGDVAAGDHVGDAVDPRTGIPVVSLYGVSKRPPAEALARIDVLLFDLQDVGARCYTYVSTLGEAMQACAEAGKPLIVLDRPNPIGGVAFEGPVREQRWKSFIGWGPIPVTHGLTAGEMARFYNAQLDLGCALEVVPMQGWGRSMLWNDTGLVWTQTSPHIPSALSSYLYVATAMAASSTANVSDGVGSTMPFELLGAEFVDARELRLALEAAELAGVRFQEIAWQPFYGKFAKRPLRGVRLVLDDPHAFRPVRAAVTFLTTLRQLYPDQLELESVEVLAKHWGNERFRERLLAGDTAAELAAGWKDELALFAAAREQVLLYR